MAVYISIERPADPDANLKPLADQQGKQIMTILSNITDLKNWLNDRVNAETSEAEIEQSRPSNSTRQRPPKLGNRWSEYLEAVDIEAIIVGNL